MINIIGVRKVGLIITLIVLAAALYFFGFMYLKPQLIKEDRKLKASQSEFSQIKTNMDNLVVGIAQFETQKDEFNKLRAYGFFDSQDRLDLVLRFDAMQETSRLLSAKYSIKPVEEISNPLATEAGFKIINTRVIFDVDAVEDVDVYRFIHLLNYGFPAQVFISNIEIIRQTNVTRTLIQRLGSGNPVSVVKANITVDFKTMVENESAQNRQEGGAY